MQQQGVNGTPIKTPLGDVAVEAKRPTSRPNGITALPLHDSVLVAASEAGAAEEVMKEAFARVTGESGGKLKVDCC